ncbi:MAG: bifunctional diguanylate cyclase/phosphodiesterase, partial [Pseudomonadota bacterium]
KEINDTLGHDVGDQLLRQVGQRLLLCVRQSDTVARLGGDEFTVILGQLEDVGSVTNVAQNILMKLAEPFKLGNDIAYISASIGITVYPKDATTVGDLLKNADQAMYNSKEMGRNRLSYFTRSMQEVAQMRMALTNEMRVALASNQFCAVYQPIVDLNTGVIHKAEALLRWQHPTRGLIYPAEFIPIAEHTGMIIGLGDWIFYDAVRQALRWRKSDPDFQVSVNVSPVQFHRDGNNYVRWFDYLKKSRLPEKNICAEISVEITEGVLLDASTSILNQLLSFRDAGIQVSLDDFGTGYSSLAYLRKFDIDYLKIDQSFVTNLEENDDNLALCEAIIVMAHKLNLKVIAEGVETATQRDLLRQAGCDYAQGYLFSVPLNAKDFDDLLRQGAISDAQHR